MTLPSSCLERKDLLHPIFGDNTAQPSMMNYTSCSFNEADMHSSDHECRLLGSKAITRDVPADPFPAQPMYLLLVGAGPSVFMVRTLIHLTRHLLLCLTDRCNCRRRVTGSSGLHRTRIPMVRIFIDPLKIIKV